MRWVRIVLVYWIWTRIVFECLFEDSGSGVRIRRDAWSVSESAGHSVLASTDFIIVE